MTLSPKRTLQRTNRFSRDIKTLPVEVQQEAFNTAQKLCRNVFDQEFDVKPMTGLKGFYRVVISHYYRMIFSYDDLNIYLRRIAHRKDIYRNLEL